MLRLALTGPHGTGKTTLIKALSAKLEKYGRVSTCREAPRLIIDRVGDSEFFRRESNTTARQALIFLEHIMEERRASLDADIVLSDRTLVDHLAYTTVLFPKEVDTPEVRIYREIAYESLSTYEAIFQLPIEFAPEDDGVREADINFQRAIDETLTDLYREAGVTPIIVRGSVVERSAQVETSVERLLI
ncbi:MAG: ATP-binding protein [Pseudomonadota bacterium]